MAMTLDQAVAEVRRTFPHPKYIHPDRERAWRHTAEHVMKHVPAGGSVLDFGSGPCDSAAVLALMGFQTYAGDDLLDSWHLQPGMRDKILKFARDTGVDFALLESTGPLPWRPQQFDMVMLHHVLEHIGESPRELMNAIVSCTKDGGHVFVTVPSAVNIRKRIDVLRGRTNYPGYDAFFWFPSPWRGHRREYCKGDLHSLAKNLGIRVVDVRSYHAMLDRLPGSVQGVYKAVTGIITGWRDSWMMIAQRPRGWAPLSEPPAGSALLSSHHFTGET
jgi:SAM-dependent methyltransferase